MLDFWQLDLELLQKLIALRSNSKRQHFAMRSNLSFIPIEDDRLTLH